jgi:hypothetical protein
MRILIKIFGLFCLIVSCSKTDVPIPIATAPVAPVVVTPPTPIITLKNYLQTSYELQQSDVNIDIMKLRATKEGINSGWNILAVAFLDINADGNDDIFYNAAYGDTTRTPGKIFIYKNGDYILDNSYFTTPPSLVAARKAIVGDYNNDKMPDIFIAATGYDVAPFSGEYNELLLSNVNKKYDLVKFTARSSFYHGASSGDIDKDGDLDIFVVGKPDSYFLINDGKGNFAYSTTQLNISTLVDQFTCELIDIDKDGYLDLIMGGHEFMPGNTTRIYWGDATYKYTNKSDIPLVANLGVITDLDIYDLDGDGTNEVVVTRTGGKNDFSNFYSGWYIQVLSLANRKLTDATSNYIGGNVYTQTKIDNQEWIPWMRFGDFDKNGKVDFYSTKCTNLNMVRWELQNKKLVRIQ